MEKKDEKKELNVPKEVPVLDESIEWTTEEEEEFIRMMEIESNSISKKLQ